MKKRWILYLLIGTIIFVVGCLTDVSVIQYFGAASFFVGLVDLFETIWPEDIDEMRMSRASLDVEIGMKNNSSFNKKRNKLIMKSSTNNKTILLSWLENNLTVVLIVSCVLIVVVPFIFSRPAFCRLFEIHEGHNVGDAIGGITAPIIGIVSILLLCLTLRAQKDAEFRSALENRIFQMIHLHRKNVEEMHSEAKNIDGQDVFNMISSQIEECVSDVAPFLHSKKIEQVFSDEFANKLMKLGLDTDLLSFAVLDIAYSTVYLGVKEENIQTLKALLLKRYQEQFISPIIMFLSLRLVNNNKKAYGEWKKLCEEPIEKRLLIAKTIVEGDDNKISNEYPELSKKSYKKLYWGHAFRLGHYFRHLYSTVEYIDSQNNLSKDEKYEYVKILRTQLSNTEQMVFLANSLSDMGGPWELFRKEDDGKRFITTYNLIKNIPQKEIYGVKYRMVFPDVDYEF